MTRSTDDMVYVMSVLKQGFGSNEALKLLCPVLNPSKKLKVAFLPSLGIVQLDMDPDVLQHIESVVC